MKRLRSLQESQPVRFVVVGILNTVFSYVVYASLVYFGLAYALANLVALVLGIVFSFTTQGSLVFRSSGGPQFVKFVVVWALLYCVSTALIARMTARGLSAYVAGAVALLVTSALSYLAQKYFVFRKSNLSVVD